MEKFQKFLRDDSSNELVYDFEKADVTINGERKERGRGCDYVVISGNVRNCNLVLIECKGGELSISHFEDAKRQLEYSVDFVKKAFDDVPDLAVVCYDQCKAQVVEYMRAPSNKWLRHGVRLIPLKSNAAKCRVCR
jgi:mRNA-degrading endonuclease RelE of RelBE toxin-antitoxin system